MHRFRLHITPILSDMRARLQTVCPTVYIGNRPMASKTENKEFLVLNTPYSFRDKGAFQNSYFRVEIYVKTKAQDVPNIKRLEEIANGILDLCPITANKRYIARKPQLTLQGNDTMGFTVWYLQGSLLVNTLDSYSNND